MNEMACTGTGDADSMQIRRQKLAENRRLADALKLRCEALVREGVEGAGILLRKICSEITFLEELEGAAEIKPAHVQCSNLGYYAAILDKADMIGKESGGRDNISAVLKPVPWSGGTLRVDLVTDLGFTWVKVVARNAVNLHNGWMGTCNSAEKSITAQARTYLRASRENCNSRVVFHFASGITRPLAEALRSMGIEVEGTEVDPPAELSGVADDEAMEGSSEEDESYSGSEEDFEGDDRSANNASGGVSAAARPINLDITAMFALVSSLTNGHANYRFTEPLLNDQAAMERESPVLPFVQRVIRDRKLICCATAWQSFCDIVGIVGGPGEQARASELNGKIEVRPDSVSEKFLQGLKLTGNVKERSRIIFGSGDYYDAITLSANKGFVQAAFNQGVKFAVILHGSRALSEQKQMHATPLSSALEESK